MLKHWGDLNEHYMINACVSARANNTWAKPAHNDTHWVEPGAVDSACERTKQSDDDTSFQPVQHVHEYIVFFWNGLLAVECLGASALAFGVCLRGAHCRHDVPHGSAMSSWRLNAFRVDALRNFVAESPAKFR